MTRFARQLAGRIREDDRGMTIIELMIGMLMATVIMLAAFFAMESGNRMATRTAMRVDAINRGRVGMESITRAIRSQQCFNGTRPMLWASNTGLDFYASIAPEATTTYQPIERHHIEWMKQTNTPDLQTTLPVGDIVETIYRSSTNAAGVTTFPTKPSSIRTIAEDVQQAPDRDNQAVLAPFFQYYEYSPTTGSGRIDDTAPVQMFASAASVYNPLALNSAPVADLPKIVLVEISYAATPRRQKSAKSANVNFYNTVSVRIADPTNPAGSPQCL